MKHFNRELHDSGVLVDTKGLAWPREARVAASAPTASTVAVSSAEEAVECDCDIEAQKDIGQPMSVREFLRSTPCVPSAA